MDVTAQTFPYHLARMLEDLASSVFVAIDLEFSGIFQPPQGRAGRPQSLQTRYEEVKDAASMYQIIQVGLTFCHEDTEAAKYSLKPYNLFLNPIIDRRLEVERNWSMQSSAIEFLLEHKFNMDSLYRTGVQYISRSEEAQAVAKAVQRQTQTNPATSLDVKDTDLESLGFLNSVRRLLDDWLALGDKRSDHLNVPPPSREINAQGLKAMPSVLNRFQKRLVHQLVEVEYAGLVTISRPTFIQIIEYNEEREKTIQDQRVQRVQERAWKETGFRWIAEALAGGDLTNLSHNHFPGIRANTAPKEQGETLNEFVDDFKQRLKSHRPVLVGHNLFTDLIYFFRCFFGPLPDRVEEFQSMVYEHFPVLIDTKYLATHDCGSINPTSSLQEINNSLLKMPKPEMSIHPHFARYQLEKVDHEAGYDSLLTAQVFIRLSAQLGKGNQSVLDPQSPSFEPRKRQVDLNNQFAQLQVQDGSEGPEDTSSLGSDEVLGEENSPGDAKRKAKRGLLIPRRDFHFWKIYGNKLRVFGSEERVCHIG